jgi:ADP-heptose:LPS heptosyltransferase
VGTPVVSVYPPIQVQHPDRWGPYVAGARARVLVPVTREECGERFKCRGSACKFYPCMERVSSDDVLKAVTQLAARG